MVRGFLPLAGLPSALMPPVILHAWGEGPLLAVVAGLSGGEAGAVAAVLKLSQALAQSPPSDGLGAVALVPCLMPMALFARRSRQSPVDGQDLARAFPGSPRGGSSTPRIAYALMEELAQHAQAVLELRSPDADEAAVGYWEGTATTPAAWRTSLPRVRYACAAPQGSLAAEAAARGLGSACLHLPEGTPRRSGEAAPHLPPSVVQALVAAVAATGPTLRQLPAAWTAVAPAAGLWQPRVRPGRRVGPGEPLGVLFPLDGRPAVPVTSGHEGTVLSVRTAGGTRGGDRLVAGLGAFRQQESADAAAEPAATGGRPGANPTASPLASSAHSEAG